MKVYEKIAAITAELSKIGISRTWNYSSAKNKNALRLVTAPLQH